jgi:hypothetical protein
VPDVIYLESSIVRHFIEGPFMANLNHLLPEAQAIETYQFVLDIGTYDGELRALSWQATPGAMFYRRSMARQIFGTDDPAVIQNYFRDIPTTLDSARRIRDESNGTMFFTNHFAAFANPFYNNRTQGWIYNNSLVIDQAALDYMNFARTVRDEGLDANVHNWSFGWWDSMSDEFTDFYGNQLNIFSYMLPTWGLNHVTYINAHSNLGDWAIIPGPLPYQWGGSWLGVPRAATNPDLGELFIRSLTLDPDVLADWALGTFTHEFLLQYNPGLHPFVHQPGGDFVSSAYVVRNIADQFYGSSIYYFLGGQNHYTVFGEAALLVDHHHLVQSTDASIQSTFSELVALYITNIINTREEALDIFRESIHMQMPWLRVAN